MLGFLFIGGWGNVKKQLVGNVDLHTCPVCHQLTRWDVYQIDKRATVYFVPVYKYDSRKVVICANCRNGSEVSDLDIATLRSQAEAGPTVAPAAQPGVAAAPTAPASFKPAPAPIPRPAVQPAPHSRPRVAPAQQPAPTVRGASPPGAASAPPVPQFAHVPVGTDPALATWMRGLQGILVKYNDARGVTAAMLDRWVKTAGAYAPPK